MTAAHGRRRYVLAAGALVVVAGGGAAAYALRPGPAPARTTGAAAVATAAVTRGDVVDTEAVDGTLTYAGHRDLPVTAPGVVTWVPPAGDTITRGHTLMRVADRPVTLMYGRLPMYRTLRDGVTDGPDVAQLEANLAALGYGAALTVDDTFTAATAAAVKAWQDDRGLPVTGRVDASQVVFAPGTLRVAKARVAVGDRVRPGGPALAVTGTSRLVYVKLDAGKQDLAHPGEKVRVELPDGRTLHGRITKIGAVAAGSHGGTATVGVSIHVPGTGTGRLDEAPVTVDVVSDRAEDVLSVPVEALLALREGGYGVETVTGATHRVVAVTTGTYGGGRVEISGAGLHAGTRVEVPAT